MDILKRETVKDYTAHDLNCRNVVRETKEKKRLRKIFKRKARRNNKKELKKVLTDFE